MATHPQGIQSTGRSLCQSQAYVYRFPSNSPDIPQTFIKFTVLQICSRHNDTASRRIDEVFGPDRAALLVHLAAMGRVVAGSPSKTDFGLFEDLGTKLSGVAEHQLVEFRSYLENVTDSISIARDGPGSRQYAQHSKHRGPNQDQ